MTRVLFLGQGSHFLTRSRSLAAFKPSTFFFHERVKCPFSGASTVSHHIFFIYKLIFVYVFGLLDDVNIYIYIYILF